MSRWCPMVRRLLSLFVVRPCLPCRVCPNQQQRHTWAPRGGEQNRSNLCGGGHGLHAAVIRWCVSSHAAAWAAWVINLVLPKPSHPESCMPHASATAQRCQWDKHPARMEVQAIPSIQLCNTRARKWWWRFGARTVVPTCFRCAATGVTRKNITASSTSTGNASPTPSFLDHCAKLPRLWKGTCLSFIDLSPENKCVAIRSLTSHWQSIPDPTRSTWSQLATTECEPSQC